MTVFIARRVWWRIPLVYNPARMTQEDQGGATPIYRYPSATANYVLSVYEIPSQLPISGNANLQIGNNADGTTWGSGVTISGMTLGSQGSIYASQIQLAGGTYERHQFAADGECSQPGDGWRNTLFEQRIRRDRNARTIWP